MTHVLKMRGSKQNPVAISYEQMLTFHGGPHPGGVAVAYKVLETAFPLISPDGPPERSAIQVAIGVDGPGVVDGLECATRAFSRQRAVLDHGAKKGQAVCGEHFWFEIRHKGTSVSLWLKEGTLTSEFLALAAKAAGGLASDAEVARFDALRHEMADRVLASPAADLFEIGPVVKS